MSREAKKMLKIETDHEGVCALIFDAEGETVNTLRAEFAQEFTEAFNVIEADESIRAVVLLSAKPDNFVAGADISMLAKVTSAHEASELSRIGQSALRRVAECRVPVVAGIAGACLGGGLEIALSCHGRIASTDDKTKLGLPEVQLGILPGMGGTVRLPRLVGLSTALDLLLTGKQLSAKKALRVGLVDEVVPPDLVSRVARERALLLSASRAKGASTWTSMRELLDPSELKELALADNPLGRKVVFDTARKQLRDKTYGNYPAPERILSVVKVGLEQGESVGFEQESVAFGELVVSLEARALRHVYFSGQSLKKDYKASSAPTVEYESVGVLGAGLMGAGVAYVSSAVAKCHVRLKDVSTEGLAQGLRSIDKILSERVTRRRLTSREREEALRRITTATDLSGFAGLDIVIEAVFEDLGLKKRLVSELQGVAENAIFASNTSSLPIGAIAEGARSPERVIGMHYFSPVHRMPLLEIIVTPQTAPEVVDSCVNLGRRQGKTVIVVGDGPGFYTTRILGPYLNEAAFCLVEGASVEGIDSELVQAGFPVGPFTLLDEIGIDVGTHVGRTLREALGERLAPPAELAKVVLAGRLGRKNKSGFYDYKGKSTGKRPVDESIYAVLGLEIPRRNAAQSQPEGSPAIAERCILAMVNEAAHCLGEGILKNPRDGDIGAIYGLGFPPFLGGPFHFVDSEGAAEIVDRLERLQRIHGDRFAPAPRLRQLVQSGSRFFA